VKKRLVLFVLLLMALAVAGVSPGPADPTVEVLRTKDQALLDAIALGDRKVWDEALARAVYVDENGVIIIGQST